MSHPRFSTLRESPARGFREQGAAITMFVHGLSQLLHIDPVRLRKSCHAPSVVSTTFQATLNQAAYKVLRERYEGNFKPRV